MERKLPCPTLHSEICIYPFSSVKEEIMDIGIFSSECFPKEVKMVAKPSRVPLLGQKCLQKILNQGISNCGSRPLWGSNNLSRGVA